jgi:hypothetical protein
MTLDKDGYHYTDKGVNWIFVNKIIWLICLIFVQSKHLIAWTLSNKTTQNKTKQNNISDKQE